MTIEQKIADALADLRGLLSEDFPVEQALVEISDEYGLKLKVLRERGEKQFGDLSQLACSVTAASLAARRASKIKGSAYRLCRSMFADSHSGVYFDIVAAVEADLGLRLSADEMLLVCKERNEAFHRKMLREIGNVPAPESLS